MAFTEQLESVMERTFGSWLAEPPPPYAFEFSQGGIAWFSRAASNAAPIEGFEPIDPEALAISPMKDNVVHPEVLERAIARIAQQAAAGQAKKLKPAALILPDYSTRVAVLEFESFPQDKDEQLSLVRFRMKKAVPFDLDEAAISYSARPSMKIAGDDAPAKPGVEVVAAAAPVEVIARYEAPLRSAGFVPGYVTSSALASMDLLDGLGLVMSAKLAGRVLTVTVSEGTRLTLLRCVELEEATIDEIAGVLAPTLVFAEDELPSRPAHLAACGFGNLMPELETICRRDLGLDVKPMASPWGRTDAANAGLRGYWMANAGVR